MNVVIAMLDETDGLRSEELRWPLRLASMHGGDITFVVPVTREAAKSKNVDLRAGAEDDPLTQALGVPLRALLDQELTPEGWVEPRESTSQGEATEPQEAAPILVALRVVPTEQIRPTVLSLVEDANQDMLVLVRKKLLRAETVGLELLRDAACELAYVIPGQRQADGEILFEPSREQYARGAGRLASSLARSYQRKATGLWIEPEVGPDSEGAGRRMLDRVLDRSLVDEATQMNRRVEVDNSPASGILHACADERYEVMIMGIPRPGAAGLAEVRVPVQVARGTNQPTLIFTRAAMPLQMRLQTLFDYHLRRVVPQLQRGERADFVARVQASSEWNFDFIALMGLATAIARTPRKIGPRKRARFSRCRPSQNEACA